VPVTQPARGDARKRIVGHARITITLEFYTHLFDGARHAGEIRRQIETSELAALLESDGTAPGGLVARPAQPRAARILRRRGTDPDRRAACAGATGGGLPVTTVG
jgi:hypothetical protein